ncbi:MAG: DUF1853 family protein [Proteobacteria bacterium]|nr:DUF1853 family protein [Pseudomonadota bacterium]
MNITEYSFYKTPQVRALVWSLISPGLVKYAAVYPACVEQQWCLDLYEKLKPFLQDLDQHPDPLIQYLEAQKSWRLGIRFEAYWTFIFEQLKKQSELKRYESHIQIQRKDKHKTYNETLGEIDFIYQDMQQQFTHLEIAVKFYCLKPDEFGFERLLGPNGHDWLERKLEHLFNKQLPLSNTVEAQEKLIDLFSADLTDEKHINCHPLGLVKGMIFLPVTGEEELNEKELSYINPQLLNGKWGTIDNWYLSDPGETGRWVMLEKLDWLVPQIFESLEDHLYTAKEMTYKLDVHFNHTKRSVLIVQVDFDETQQLWLEQQRVMVVDKHWPTFLQPA